MGQKPEQKASVPLVEPVQTRNAALPVVAIAASLGGLAALGTVLGSLPATLPAAVLVLQHLQPGRPSLMPALLERGTSLPVVEARHGDVLRPGTVYTAPADRHLRVNPDRSLSLTEGDRVHFSRPSADVLFESLADSVGPLAVAVVLTGRGVDGAAGALAVRDRGGTVIAQDEATSRAFGMPGSAARNRSAMLVLPLKRIAPRLVALLETLQTVPA